MGKDSFARKNGWSNHIIRWKNDSINREYVWLWERFAYYKCTNIWTGDDICSAKRFMEKQRNSNRSKTSGRARYQRMHDSCRCIKLPEKTADAVISGKADYLLCAKDNQKTLKQDIETYVQDVTLRKNMEWKSRTEKNRDRIEKRTAFLTDDIKWLPGKEEWTGLACIGAIHTEFEAGNKKTDKWHYYISSRKLTAEELQHHARMEWSVETMHWLLDVHFGEDGCRIEDKNIQQNLNMFRKLAINLIKKYRENSSLKRSLSKIMFDCLLEPSSICNILENWFPWPKTKLA